MRFDCIECNRRGCSQVARFGRHKWRQQMLTGARGGTAMTSLERYMRIKPSLRSEWFLGWSRVWVRKLVQMRGGVQDLMVTTGRRKNHDKVPRSKRLCKLCDMGVVEDEEHFWLRCEHWSKQRRELWHAALQVDAIATRRAVWLSGPERLDWMMQGGSYKTRWVLGRRMVAWMHERSKITAGEKARASQVT